MTITEPILKGFKIYRQSKESANLIGYSRADLYKICLFNGKGKILFNGKSYPIDGDVLFFGLPQFYYEFESGTIAYEAYSCIFTKDFISECKFMSDFQEEVVASERSVPIYYLNEIQRAHLLKVFKGMLFEQSHHYRYRVELIENYLKLIILEAIKPNLFEGVFFNRVETQ